MLAALFFSAAGALHAWAQLASAGGQATSAATPSLATHRVVLLGEVHDNAAQHALRLQAFESMLASGARPALLMEQFDRERQPAIDEVLARPGAADADRVIAAGSAPGARWNWDFYRSFIALALRHELLIVAVNVSREEARQVMARGLEAQGFDAAVPTDIAMAHANSIAQSHCGMVDAAHAGRMALAQVARDQFMARAIEHHAQRGAVLLAGNGHVRKDVGVPRWLAPATREQAVAIGFIEDGDDAAGVFDHTVITPRQQRDDPCTSMRRPAAAST